MEKPKNRSQLRIKLGKLYYTLKRYFKWYLGKEKYAKKYHPTPLPFTIFMHQTPLYRQLKNVDMWLQDNKVENLKIAVKRINHILIQPGETFSYWKLIGKTSKRKGYKKGMVLFYGNFQAETGGGLCQLSNLIYWLVLHSPLTITERYRHSYDVFPDSHRTQPFGSGATCVYPYRDLQFYNGTNTPYQLNVFLDNTLLYGKITSTQKPLYHYRIYEKSHTISQEYWGGYLRHNTIYKQIFNQQDELVDDLYVSENHALMMYQPFLSNTHTTDQPE